jgi:hypothetical protein
MSNIFNLFGTMVTREEAQAMYAARLREVELFTEAALGDQGAIAQLREGGYTAVTAAEISPDSARHIFTVAAHSAAQEGDYVASEIAARG